MPALFLSMGKIKRRTMRMESDFPLSFSDLRFFEPAAAPTAVSPSARATTKSVGYDRAAISMKTHVLWVLLAVLAGAIAPGCSRKPHAEHATESHAPEPPPPTPDTTPIPILRTPAGLVLGVEGTPAPAVPTPGADQPVEVVTPPPVG